MGKQKTPTNTQLQTTTLGDAYSAFVLSRQAMGVSPRTLTYYSQQLRPFLDWCDGPNTTTVDAITAGTARAYLVHLQGRGLGHWTQHGAARAIRAFLRFCASDGLIDTAPVFAMPKVPKTILPAFETAEVDRLLHACLAERDELIVLMLLDTGLRASELCALDGSDIDANTGAVFVRMGKGQKQRTVFLGTHTRRVLARYWRNSGKPGPTMPVWVSAGTGKRLTDSGLRQLLQRLGERANVAHSHPHTYRRTFALWSLRAGMDVHSLAALMGHADIGVLRQYLALTGEDLRRAHQQHSTVDNLQRRAK